MFRVLRNLALAVAGLLSLLVIAVVIATTFIDPNTYKPRIEQLVQEHTHLKLQLGGDLEWSLIPLGLELNDVQTRLGGEPFVSMRTLIAQVDFWSVLRMQPAVNTVLLDGLDAQLVRHKDGTGNWEQVLKTSPDVRKEAADTSAPAESTTSAQPLPINIQQIRIADSRVSLQDAQSGQSIALDSLNLDVVGIDVDGAIGVDSVRLFGANLGVSDTAQGLELRLENLNLQIDNLHQDTRLNIQSVGTADLNLRFTDKSGQRVELDKLGLQLSGLDMDLQNLAGSLEKLKLSGARVYWQENQGGQALTLEKLAVNTGQLKPGSPAPLELGFELQLTQPELRLTTQFKTQVSTGESLRQFELANLDLRTQLQGEPTGQQPVDLTLKGAIKVDLDQETASLQDLALTFANLAINTALNVKGFGDKPQLSGTLAVAPFSLPALLKATGAPPIPTQDPKALEKIALNALIAGPAGKVELNDLLLQLDDTTFKGQAAYTLSNSAVLLKLNGQSLDVDRYLPPPAPESATTTTATAAAPASTPEADLLPLDSLRTLALDIQFALDELKVKGLAIQQFKSGVKAQSGQIEVAPLSGKLLDGHFDVSASLDARSNEPRWQIRNTLSGVQILPLLTQLADVDMLSGAANLNLNLATRGNRLSLLREHASGQAEFSLANGALEGMTLHHLACEGIALVNQEALASQDWGQRTPFNDMRGTLLIKGNTLDNTLLSARMAGLMLEGQGQVDLKANRVDYGLGLRVTGDIDKDPACRVNERVQGISLPVRCEGSLDGDNSKLCRFDTSRFADTLKALAAAELQRKAGKELDRVLDKQLDKLFNRGRGEPAAEGTAPAAATEEGAATETTEPAIAPEGAEPAPKSDKDQAKDAVKGLLRGLIQP